MRESTRASEYYSYGNANALLERAYLAGNIANQINESSAHSAAWEQFRARWHEVETDPYMADGGRYRRRRYSEFLVDVKMQVLELLPHVPYRQPRSVNYLNGDIDRHYTPITEATIGNVVFQRIVLGGSKLTGEIHPGTTWRQGKYYRR
ncbi:hypothetical protein PHO31112_04922 [Pandoraea horticolens]|uniref:Uncharacterized protein n=1 Tax=Pandoraea horticolens TaxID=2508298 RepID=A0A5E4YZW3_9BURK|nr:2OG-Fe dioxygenase family protein [Pandoraea horticolens]VVE54386.1 hypothetical protein PHO31112_04922 [Pandoraea horticolens]